MYTPSVKRRICLKMVVLNMYVVTVGLILCTRSILAGDITIKTNVGTFNGYSDEIEVAGGNFGINKFLGIPYAEPPVGDLRFKKPLPKTPLLQPFDAKSFGNSCMQVKLLPVSDTDISEDCLFLNIYSPSKQPENGNYPVMIWLHGGAFVLGSAKGYIPDRLVANGPVIVVTLNYRLSIWGFMSTADSNSPGNYGLWDQHMAIKWVHDNIDKFGGDPTRVTIFGESAGSACAIFQGLYPGNSGLFHRIIGQSGTAIAWWSKSFTPNKDASDFAALAGCEVNDNEHMLQCLLDLPNDVIDNTINNFTNGLVHRQGLFVPYVDGEFVQETAETLLDQRSEKAESMKMAFSNYDLLSGANSGEGYLFVPYTSFNPYDGHDFSPNRTDFEQKIVPLTTKRMMSNASPALVEAIVAEYTDWNDPDNVSSIREQFCDMVGDAFFLEPLRRTVELHSKVSQRQNTYMYYFTQKPARHALPTPSWATRPNHGDDLIYVFGGEADLKQFAIEDDIALEEWEKELSDKVMTLWTNFAKTGNPNKPRDLKLDWLSYSPNHRHYLDISGDMSPHSLKTNLEPRRLNFWNKVVPSFKKMSDMKKDSGAYGSCRKDECSP